MIYACQYCGGGLEASIDAIVMTLAIGGSWILGLAMDWINRRGK